MTNIILTCLYYIFSFFGEKKENQVLVWAPEIGTMPDGKKDMVNLMETWRMNKDGKADMQLQYDRATWEK